MATRWLRLRAASIGPSHGTEAGATLILFQTWITPTLTAEAGHYSGGDAFSRIRAMTKSPYLDSSLQRSFNSDYQTGYLGIELGARDVAISINVGLTRALNSHQNIQSGLEVAPSKPVASVEDIRTAQIGPAAKIALVINL